MRTPGFWQLQLDRFAGKNGRFDCWSDCLCWKLKMPKLQELETNKTTWDILRLTWQKGAWTCVNRQIYVQYISDLSIIFNTIVDPCRPRIQLLYIRWSLIHLFRLRLVKGRNRMTDHQLFLQEQKAFLAKQLQTLKAAARLLGELGTSCPSELFASLGTQICAQYFAFFDCKVENSWTDGYEES